LYPGSPNSPPLRLCPCPSSSFCLCPVVVYTATHTRNMPNGCLVIPCDHDRPSSTRPAPQQRRAFVSCMRKRHWQCRWVGRRYAHLQRMGLVGEDLGEMSSVNCILSVIWRQESPESATCTRSGSRCSLPVDLSLLVLSAAAAAAVRVVGAMAESDVDILIQCVLSRGCVWPSVCCLDSCAGRAGASTVSVETGSSLLLQLTTVTFEPSPKIGSIRGSPLYSSATTIKCRPSMSAIPLGPSTRDH
jgi:hypothetical protein